MRLAPPGDVDTLLVKQLRAGREAKVAAGKHAVGQYAYGYHGQGTGQERDARKLDPERVVYRPR